VSRSKLFRRVAGVSVAVGVAYGLLTTVWIEAWERHWRAQEMRL
jgi:hypothetical protein